MGSFTKNRNSAQEEASGDQPDDAEALLLVMLVSFRLEIFVTNLNLENPIQGGVEEAAGEAEESWGS